MALQDAPGTWSIAVADAITGERLFERAPSMVLPSASSAKVLALVAAALAVEAGAADPSELLRRGSVRPVADSGLWQHLRVEALPLDDVARLVGTVSDNLATNVLVHRLGGVAAVSQATQRMELIDIHLHDIVRDVRRAEDPPQFSSGSASGYRFFFTRLWRGEIGGRSVSDRVLGWLRDGVDLSMVAGAFGLDPLAHGDGDRGVKLWHKTGTDVGVRADSGVVERDGRGIAYSVLVRFDDRDRDRDRALHVMGAIGEGIRRSL
jgi:Beta-lactamase class A